MLLSSSPMQNLVNPDYDEDCKASKLKFYSDKCSAMTPFLFVGGEFVARTKDILQQHGITHIVNCAADVCPNTFDTCNKEINNGYELKYMTLYLLDSASEDLHSCLYDVIDYIYQARQTDGKVLIHCHQGVSRSCSIAIGYLMYLSMCSYDVVYRYVRELRGVCRPNIGFMCQLLQWHKRLIFVPQPDFTKSFDISLLSQRSKIFSSVFTRGFKCTEKDSLLPVRRLYRITPHCSRASDYLVAKEVEMDFDDDNSFIFSILLLDPRFVFVLFCPDLETAFIWKGRQLFALTDDVANAVVQGSVFTFGTDAQTVIPYLRCARQLVLRLAANEYMASKAVYVGDANPKTASIFWSSFGIDNDCGDYRDVKVNKKYSRELEQETLSVDEVAAAIANMKSNSAVGITGNDTDEAMSSDGSMNDDEDDKSNGSDNQDNDLDRAGDDSDASIQDDDERTACLFEYKPDKTIVNMQLDENMKVNVNLGCFEKLKMFDSDDLYDDKVYVLVFYGKSVESVHVWFGSGYDLYDESTQELARKMTDLLFDHNKNVDMSNVCIELQDEESDKFWTGFADG